MRHPNTTPEALVKNIRIKNIMNKSELIRKYYSAWRENISATLPADFILDHAHLTGLTHAQIIQSYAWYNPTGEPLPLTLEAAYTLADLYQEKTK